MGNYSYDPCSGVSWPEVTRQIMTACAHSPQGFRGADYGNITQDSRGRTLGVAPRCHAFPGRVDQVQLRGHRVAAVVRRRPARAQILRHPRTPFGKRIGAVRSRESGTGISYPSLTCSPPAVREAGHARSRPPRPAGGNAGLAGPPGGGGGSGSPGMGLALPGVPRYSDGVS
jgi:hypothetical protein